MWSFIQPELDRNAPASVAETRKWVTTLLQSLRRKGVIFWLALLACMLATLYWGVVASDRYVSEAHVVIQQTEISAGASLDLSSLVGMSGGPNRTDQMLLRDHLLSVDMLEKLEARLGLRDHYSDRSWDLLSRLWGRDSSLEWFHWYYLWRVSVEFDEYVGILVIRAEGFTPEKAHEIASALVEEGERYMNELGHRLAQEQVSFIEKQVSLVNERLIKARQAVLKFQNERNMVSPQGTAEAIFAMVSQLEGQLTTLKTQRDTLLGFQHAGSPAVVDLDMQIQAVTKRIRQEQTRLTSSERQTLNRIIEEYQRLEMEAEFVGEMYKTALGALEKQRIDAARTLKMVSVLQRPTIPQYPMQPRRSYNIAVFLVATLMVAGIASLLRVIVREHRD
ncbi:MAG: hypothetical protein OEV08_09925 [Nitrospira sp.]|nr:hypothetical protein [Nitrospira sp.]